MESNKSCFRGSYDININRCMMYDLESPMLPREMPEPLYEWLEEESSFRSKFRLSSVASVDSE